MLLKDFLEINPRTRLTKGEEYGFVEMADIVPGDRYVSANQKRIYKGGGSRFQNGDILFARITPCLENTKIAQYQSEHKKKAFGSTEFIVLRNRESISIQDFLYYLALSDIVRKPAEKSMFGASGRQRVDLNAFGDIKIPSYALDVQVKIASILSTFDDLIEVNLKRMSVLKEIAQSLYSEWFVSLNFPEHGNAEIVEPSQGSMPKGWQIKNLGDVSTITMGQSPKSTYYNENGKGLPFHQGVSDFGEIFPTTRRYSTKGNRIAEPGDILFSVRAPVGRINIANTRMILGRGLCGIRSKTGDQIFLYEQLKDIFHKEDIMGGGTIFKAVTKTNMHNIKVIYPKQALIDRFEALSEPILKQIEMLSKSNRILRKLKGLVLPKLISGGFELDRLDIDTPSD